LSQSKFHFRRITNSFHFNFSAGANVEAVSLEVTGRRLQDPAGGLGQIPFFHQELEVGLREWYMVRLANVINVFWEVVRDIIIGYVVGLSTNSTLS